MTFEKTYPVKNNILTIKLPKEFTTKNNEFCESSCLRVFVAYSFLPLKDTKFSRREY